MLDMSKEITLELGLEEPKEEVVAVPEEKITESDYLREMGLSPEELKMADEFSEKIELQNAAIVLQYGNACQKKIAAFSDTVLEGVRTKDLGPTGDMIADLVTELKGFSTEPEEKGFFSFFRRSGNQLSRMKARFEDAEVNIDKITGELEGHQNQLLTDIVMFDKMYEANLRYFKELTMYIVAGKKKLEKERNITLVQMREKAMLSGQTYDAQAVNDFAALCDRFEKKLHDLELTRTISMQMAPQIRLIQNNNAVMSEKIQSTINNTIPLWKNQMVVALGLAHSRQAMEAQKEVSDLTNALLKKNADALKLGTVEIAKESERGVVDMETIRYTNEQLISTLDEVLRIQDEGKQKRRDAEAELGRIENQLKSKMLELRK